MINSFSGRYNWLSNFFPCDIELDGLWYNSVEHAYQAAKSLDINERNKIRECKFASEAKRIGKTISLRADWEDIKLEIMENLLKQKFNNKYLKNLLEDTGTQELIEGNWWHDTYWGECNGVGHNMLGKLIMKIRDGK